MDAAASGDLHRTKRPQRTAKSCGPDAATLASSWREYRADDGGKRGRSPGRARISRKAIARGKPGCLGCTCQTRVLSFATFAHGAAGASSARLSLRPLSERGTMNLQNLGQIVPRECFWLFEKSNPQIHCRPGQASAIRET